MADIIQFNLPDDDMISIKAVLKEVNSSIDSIKDIMILIKDKDNNNLMFHTGMSLADKSVFIQLIQHDIFNELTPSEDIEFTPDT